MEERDRNADDTDLYGFLTEKNYWNTNDTNCTV